EAGRRAGIGTRRAIPRMGPAPLCEPFFCERGTGAALSPFLCLGKDPGGSAGPRPTAWGRRARRSGCSYLRGSEARCERGARVRGRRAGGGRGGVDDGADGAEVHDAARLGAGGVGEKLTELTHDRQSEEESNQGPSEMDVLEPAGDGRDTRCAAAAVSRFVRD